MKRELGILMGLAILVLSAQFSSVKAEPLRFSSMMRFESHSADDPPGTNAGLNDSFLYTALSATGKITPHSYGSAY